MWVCDTYTREKESERTMKLFDWITDPQICERLSLPKYCPPFYQGEMNWNWIEWRNYDGKFAMITKIIIYNQRRL